MQQKINKIIEAELKKFDKRHPKPKKTKGMDEFEEAFTEIMCDQIQFERKRLEESFLKVANEVKKCLRK